MLGQGGEAVTHFLPPLLFVAGTGFGRGSDFGQHLGNHPQADAHAQFGLDFAVQHAFAFAHHPAEPVVQRLQGGRRHGITVGLQALNQRFGHGQQHFAVLQIVAVQPAEHIHFNNINKTAISQRAGSICAASSSSMLNPLAGSCAWPLRSDHTNHHMSARH